MSTDELLNLAIKAALSAGEAILKVYNNNFKVAYKLDASPLTEADTVANTIINHVLQASHIPIISEENNQIDFQIRKTWTTCWIVDPLDGTKEFINRNDEFTVNIALIENGITKFGIIYVPVSKDLYYTNSQKTKAYKTNFAHQEELLDKQLCNVSDEIMPQKTNTSTLKIVGSRSHMDTNTMQFVEKLKENTKDVQILSKGSSLKFCLIAEGLADIYPRFAPTMEWDTAAGQAICEAVGVSVIDYQTQKPMLYNREHLLNNYFIVQKAKGE